MIDEQILKKAIEKAVKGGYDDKIFKLKADLGYVNVYDIVFRHDFAKAFWGERYKYTDSNGLHQILKEAWKYHLQQMVLEKEPLKYLEKFL